MVAKKRGRWRSRCIGGDGDATVVVVVGTKQAMSKRGADKRAGAFRGWMRSRAVAGREIERKSDPKKCRDEWRTVSNSDTIRVQDDDEIRASALVAVTVSGTQRGTRAEENEARYATWVGGRGEAGIRAVREIGENSERLENRTRGSRAGQRRGGGAGEIDGSGVEAGAGETSQTPYSSSSRHPTQAGAREHQRNRSKGEGEKRHRAKVSDPNRRIDMPGSSMTRIESAPSERVARDMAAARTLSLA